MNREGKSRNYISYIRVEKVCSFLESALVENQIDVLNLSEGKYIAKWSTRRDLRINSLFKILLFLTGVKVIVFFTLANIEKTLSEK